MTGATTLQGTPNPEAPNPQLPIVQKLRIRYAKRGRLRFTSHRDFGRAFERAVRRAGVPIAYSSGFNPHPKISYAGASPTGAASEAEFLEIGLTEKQDPAYIAEALDNSLPDGLDIVEAVTSDGSSLAERLTHSRWNISLPGVSVSHVAGCVERFLQLDEVLVERMMKRGLRTIDCRAVVQRLSVYPATDDPAYAILDLVVRHDTPSVRPDDVLVGLRAECGLVAEATAVATRISQGPFDAETGEVGDPLAQDRDAS